jgi:protein-tyrosine sulfotransferase
MLQEPIFILGSNKSGTSLIRSLFDGHSQLFVIPLESHFLRLNGLWIDYHNKAPEKLTPEDIIDNYLSWIKYSNIKPGGFTDSDTTNMWDIKEAELLLKGRENYDDLKTSIENYIEILYFLLYKQSLPDRLRIVEKSVENAEYAFLLKTLYPKAKFIHIIRCPYSNLVSFRKSVLKNGYPFLKRIIHRLYNGYYYLEKNRLIIKDDYFVIRYEDLVSEPEKYIQKMITFTGIKKEDVLFSPTAMRKPWKGNSSSGKSFNGISSSRLNTWKKEITPVEIACVNRIFSHILIKYGYKHMQNRNTFIPGKREGFKRYIGNRLLLHFFLDRMVAHKKDK